MLTVYSISPTEEMLESIGKELESNYEPTLMSVYLSKILYDKKIENKNLFPFLKTFYENETDNSIPCYFLSYYYLIKNNDKMSKKYLRLGNRRNNFTYYKKERKKILYEYILKETNNQVCAYNPGALFSAPTNFLLWRITKKYSRENDSGLNEELFKLGQRFERNGVSVMEKISGIAIQLHSLDKKTNNSLFSELKKKRTAYRKLIEKLHGQKGRKKMLRYIKNLYEYGEVYALEQL